MRMVDGILLERARLTVFPRIFLDLMWVKRKNIKLRMYTVRIARELDITISHRNSSQSISMLTKSKKILLGTLKENE